MVFEKKWFFCLVLSFTTANLNAHETTLKGVVILMRHGVRSPNPLNHAPIQDPNAYSAQPWPVWPVKPGMLTEHGSKAVTLLGSYYQKHYEHLFNSIDKQSCSNSDLIYLRASRYERTRKTAKALFKGIFPQCKASVHALTDQPYDPLFEPELESTCQRKYPKSKEAILLRMGGSYAAFQSQLAPHLTLLSQVLHSNKRETVSQFYEETTPHIEHDGRILGPLYIASNFSQSILLQAVQGMNAVGFGKVQGEHLYQILSINAAYHDIMYRTPYIARYQGSNLLMHIVAELQQLHTEEQHIGLKHSPKSKLIIYAGHDNNIDTVAALLDLHWKAGQFPKNAVPPGSGLVFELYENSRTHDSLIRIYFVTQTVEQMAKLESLSEENPPIWVPLDTRFSNFRGLEERAKEVAKSNCIHNDLRL